ncbi:hypothetical protein, partial [Escherichia coli]|uniref:hypothetical protein n=1 Tax=Escherichia coli TaxID=562 RepID=UPI002898594C
CNCSWNDDSKISLIHDFYLATGNGKVSNIFPLYSGNVSTKAAFLIRKAPSCLLMPASSKMK